MRKLLDNFWSRTFGRTVQILTPEDQRKILMEIYFR